MSNAKPTNPKDALGTNKLPLHLWPTTASAVGSMGLLEGMLKYGRMNWRAYNVTASVYVAACKRHLDAWFEGEDCAPDSGVPHLGHALACLAILADAQAQGCLVDDRAFNGEGYRKLVDDLTPLVAKLRAQYADRDVHHWRLGDAPVAAAPNTDEAALYAPLRTPAGPKPEGPPNISFNTKPISATASPNRSETA